MFHEINHPAIGVPSFMETPELVIQKLEETTLRILPFLDFQSETRTFADWICRISPSPPRRRSLLLLSPLSTLDISSNIHLNCGKKIRKRLLKALWGEDRDGHSLFVEDKNTTQNHCTTELRKIAKLRPGDFTSILERDPFASLILPPCGHVPCQS